MLSVIKRGHRGETQRKILRFLFLKKPSNVLTRIYIYIYTYFRNLNLHKTLSQKFGFIIKTCYFHVYTLDCNVCRIYKHKLFSLSNLHSATILPTFPIFGEKKCTLPNFLKNKQNSNPHPLCKK